MDVSAIINLIYLFLLFRHVRSAFYQQSRAKKIGFNKVVSETVPSAISCVQYCKRVDPLTDMIYEKDGSCKCVKKDGSKSSRDETTVSGIFIQEKKIKHDVNVALGKPSSQSSTYKGCPGTKCLALNGNDGTEEPTTSDYDDSVNWWKVDLEKTTTIKKIIVDLNAYSMRVSGYKNLTITTRLEPTEKWIPCDKFGSPASLRLVTNCGGPVAARYVKISLYQKGFFYLDEMEVYAIDY